MSTTDNTYVPKTGVNKKYNKSPRVGILTYHRSFNYGSALQSWALSYILTGLGANVEIIDYIPMNYQYIYGDWRKPNSFKNIFFNLIHTLYHGYFVRRKRDFSDFCQKHMPLSDSEFHSARDLELYLRDFDVVICGSDQIWNPNAEDFDPTFMLSCIEAKRKISYAASIGNGDLNNCENKDEIKRSLLEFEVISVREKSGEKKLKEFLGSDKIIKTVLDPTLLLSQ